MIQSALILDSTSRIVLNRVSIDTDDPSSCNLLPNQMLSPRNDGDIGWTLNLDNEWINPNPPDVTPQDVKVRARRDAELERSDMYMLPDFPITELVREQWRQYRQDLRDIPSQSGFPDNVVWPIKPE